MGSTRTIHTQTHATTQRRDTSKAYAQVRTYNTIGSGITHAYTNTARQPSPTLPTHTHMVSTVIVITITNTSINNIPNTADTTHNMTSTTTLSDRRTVIHTNVSPYTNACAATMTHTMTHIHTDTHTYEYEG